jgi:hypothetical protein
MMTIEQLIPAIQASVSPVILISGVGLLLLSMTSRFARVVDRSRQLSQSLKDAPEWEAEQLHKQLEVMYRRSHLARTAITLACLSALLVSIIIIAVFASALFRLEAAFLIATLYIAALACLVGSLVTFLREIYISLSALDLELSYLSGRRRQGGP